MLNDHERDLVQDEEEERAPHDEGGFVLPWMALMLIVLIAMAGFGVDVWNWWYTSQKVQRAADAGALAGVPFMPNLDQQPTPNATTTAIGVVQQNGYPTATASQGAKSNQLVVTVQTTVSNYFVSLLGLQTTNITRSATAEFNAPVQMGSPVGHICNDPDNPNPDQHWCNIGAPGVDKRTGDRFADHTACSSGTYACTSGTNTEYLDSTYIYTIDVPAGSGPVDIQAYDPEYANGHTSCTNSWLTAPQIASLQAADPVGFADADTRYASGQNNWCTGDDQTNLGGAKVPQATAWIVRGHDVSDFQALQNAPITGCSRQFQGYSPDGQANQSTYWFDLLNPATQDLQFYRSFHRWYTLCTVSQPGKYFIQVRSSVPFSAAQSTDPAYLTKSENPPETENIAGQNRYSVRVVNANTNNVTPNASAFAVTRLPVYTNTTGSNTPNFFLARLLPGGGQTGRILQLQFYDIGDLASGTTTTLNVIPPGDRLGSAITCSDWVFNGNPANAFPSGASANGCQLTGITSASYPGGFNGVLVDVKVKVPADYTCGNGMAGGVNNPLACWFKINMSYSGGAIVQANDTTTWSATIGGDPVRLVK